MRSLHIAGREWLLPDDALDPRIGAPPIEGSGWEECAPAAGAGTIPSWVKGIGGRPVPAGGEARSKMPDLSVSTAPDGHSVECTWRGDRMPWMLQRRLLVRPDGAVEARYEATATGDHRLPFLWSAHFLFPLSADTRVKLPDAGRLRLSAVSGTQAVGTTGTDALKWPKCSLDGKPRDLSIPWSVPRKTRLQGWVDLPGGRVQLQLTQGGQRLTIGTDGAGVPFCGVVIDRAGTRRGERRGLFGRTGAPALALIPSLGAPDSYARALGDWQSITWLVPGEPRRWTLTLRVDH